MLDRPARRQRRGGRPPKRAIVVESPAQSARLAEGLDVLRDFLVAEEILVARPMRQEMAQVQFGRAPRGADQLFRQRQLMETLIPGLLDVREVEPSHPDS